MPPGWLMSRFHYLATLAWLVLGACQTLADEAPDAVPDRLAALAAFIRPGGGAG